MSAYNRAVRYLHRWNAVALTAFIAVHVSVNLSAWGGDATHHAWRDAARAVYQHRVVEPVLVLLILAQVATGLQRVRRHERMNLSALSGLYLAMFLLMHSGATIGTRRIAGLDTDIDWAAGSLAYGAVGMVFALYYGLAIVSLCLHLHAALRLSGRTVNSRVWPAMAGLGLATLIMLPMSPLLRDSPPPEDVRQYYHALYGWSGQVPDGPV